ncbi:MAG: hypothetical protein ACTSSJ_01110 [Candidatus Odinarchaeia archaeon]
MLLYAIILFILTPGLILVASQTAGKYPRLTRKLLHSSLFILAAVIYSLYGVQYLTLYGLFLFPFTAPLTNQKSKLGKAVLRGDGQREMFVGLGLTVSASFINATLFPQYFIYGALIAAIGDTCGDIVGYKIGKLKYHVPLTDLTLKALKLYVPRIYNAVKPSEKQHSRSIEGSIALMISSTITLSAFIPLEQAVVCGVAAAFFEAISPRNTDNFILQLSPSIILPFF